MCKQVCPSQEQQSRKPLAGGQAGSTTPAGHLTSQPVRVHVNSGLLLSRYCAESSASLSAVKETAGMIHCHKASTSSERCPSLPCLGTKQSIVLGVDTEAEGPRARRPGPMGLSSTRLPQPSSSASDDAVLDLTSNLFSGPSVPCFV